MSCEKREKGFEGWILHFDVILRCCEGAALCIHIRYADGRARALGKTYVSALCFLIGVEMIRGGEGRGETFVDISS